MKRRIFLVLALVVAAVSMFSLNGCMEMTNGTGVLNVHVYDAKYDTEIKVLPYGADYRDNPIATSEVKKGPNRDASFTLNAGNYLIYCGLSSQAAQVQEGDEITIYFNE